ncbi:MAG: ATP-binding protein [Candidatus Competibacterales bacterium]
MAPGKVPASGSTGGRWWRFTLLVTVVVLGSIASITAFRSALLSEQAIRNADLEGAAQDLVNDFRVQLSSQLNALPLLAAPLETAFRDSTPRGDQMALEAVLQGAYSNYGRVAFDTFTDMVLLGWVDWVLPADAEGYERRVGEAAEASFAIVGLDDAATRPQPNIHLEAFAPLRHRQGAPAYTEALTWLPLGGDLGQNPRWRDAMLTAADSGEVALSLEDVDQKTYLLGFYPLYAGAGDALQGYVLAVLDVGAIARGALGDITTGAGLSLYSTSDGLGGNLLYASGGEGSLSASDGPRGADVYSPFAFANLSLAFAFDRGALGAGSAVAVFPFLVLGLGLVTTALLFSVLLATQRQQRAAEVQASADRAELDQAQSQLRESEELMVQTEKMSALGRMVAGVAHEVNTPLGFVQSNLELMTDYMADFKAVSAEQKTFQELVDEGHIDNMGDMLEESLLGLNRITELVQSLKNFSRMDRFQLDEVDLHQCLDSTLVIANNVLKSKVEVIREYGVLPKVHCAPSQLNQVFLNIITNGAQAIADRGSITITTWLANDCAHIAIKDTGSGMPSEVVERIFEPFFTTKDVGEGTGLGLSISYKIVQQHQGEIQVDSVPGLGTTFTVIIPVKPPLQQAA